MNLKLALPLLAFAALAAETHAASVQGTVTNKTTGRPAAGDTVLLIDVQQGMAEVEHATTDAQGHFKLNKPGASPYLVRAMHQGAGYFVAAPEGNQPAEISVYDVAAKIDGLTIIEDVYGVVEAQNGQLHVVERWVVRNSSSPQKTQWSPKTFEIALPAEATIQESSAQRPGGLPTTLSLDADGPKGHYSFNFPIQPDDGDKHTLFQVEYLIPYSGKYTFHPQVSLPAHTVWVVLPKAMAIAGPEFKSAPQDPSMQTFVAQGAEPGKPLEFTVSGEGALPRDNQGDQGQQAQGGQPGQGNQSMGPGGGIGNPIGSPDPLSKYKWWILGGLGLLLAAAAAFLLRKPAGAMAPAPAASGSTAEPSAPAQGSGLLAALKEELFQLEADKLSGKLSEQDYAEHKAALEKVLKRALNG